DPAPPYSMACSSQTMFNPPAPPYATTQMGMNYGPTHYTPYQPPSYYALPPASASPSSSTTVIIQQPQAMVGPNGRRLWSTKICDCCKDMNI
ncbi:hypothetical protein BgiBS90_029848, partial [Biomphalaria glabrata]